MRLIEVWGYDDKTPSLLVYNNFVENGAWEGNFDKEKNEVFIKYTEETHPCFYLGDCNTFSNDYNKTFEALENGTIEILGKNLIKYEKKIVKQEIDEPIF